VNDDQDLRSAANQSYIGSYRTLAGHCPAGEILDLGGVFAFTTGLPFALFNGSVVVEAATPTQLEQAIDWVDEHGLPHRVWIDEARAPGLGEVPQRRGFVRDERPYPGMVLHPVPDPPPPSPGVEVVQIGQTNLAEYLGVTIEAGMPAEAARLLFSASFAADPDVELFIGRLDRRAVGTAVAIRSGSVSGIYAVGTLPVARRRGVGSALTWAAVDVGRAWGCDSVVLQASEMGLPIYASMGFRTVVEYTVFGRPVQRGD
jgi:GNAT superfamily N-acetyltransferase